MEPGTVIERKRGAGWCQLRLRVEVRTALRDISWPKESYGETILRLVQEHRALVRETGPWASTGAPHPTEAVQAAPRREPQPEAPKDAGVQGPVVKAEGRA